MIIMKCTNIQCCERLGHGWQFHSLPLIDADADLYPGGWRALCQVSYGGVQPRGANP